jgi:predicted SnoaL-like aldol condensation-catalyzing enzyme
LKLIRRKPAPIHQVLKTMTVPKKEQIRALLKSIETGDPEPIAVVNEAKYIQHNPQTHEGSEGLAYLFKRLSKTEPRVNMVRAFEDRDFVFAHMEYDFASRKIGFEVFRFEDGQAVEHWDNIEQRQEPNQSARIEILPIHENRIGFGRNFYKTCFFFLTRFANLTRTNVEVAVLFAFFLVPMT